jgi:hypothetical protein
VPRLRPAQPKPEPVVVEAATNLWLSSGRHILRGDRLPITDPDVKEQWQYFRHPARPVEPEEVASNGDK